MSTDAPISERIIAGSQNLRNAGLTGDIGLGAIAGLAVGLPLYVLQPGPSVFGLPSSMVWASAAAVAVFMCSLSFGASA